MLIPDWNEKGLISPVQEGAPGHSSKRSPYSVDLVSFVNRFAISEERCRIVEGFLKYRKALHNIGMIKGFQWLDGSFLENIEQNENRAPKDIDIVTFFEIPSDANQKKLASSHPDIFISSKAKEKYFVDTYFFEIGKPITAIDVKLISYWYSMWSHRRDDVWKGFIQIDLSPVFDDLALEELEIAMKEVCNGL